MRKITEESVRAFIEERQFNKSNMAVLESNGETHLALFGKVIAKKSDDIYYITDCGWQTATTKERLNGLLLALDAGQIWQDRGQWFFYRKADNLEIHMNKNRWYQVN